MSSSTYTPIDGDTVPMSSSTYTPIDGDTVPPAEPQQRSTEISTSCTRTGYHRRLRRRAAATIVFVGGVAATLLALDPSLRRAARQALAFEFKTEGPDFSYLLDCRGKELNSYQCVYGGPGVSLDPEACVDPHTAEECFDERPLCKDVTKCYTGRQCAEKNEVCNREMVRRDGFLYHPGMCTECETLSMAECLMHPCKCKLVDLVNRCKHGEAAEACRSYVAAGCEERNCDHTDFLVTGGQGFHYLGGSNIIDESWVDRTPDLEGKNSAGGGGGGGGSFAQASTDAGGAPIEGAAEADAAALAAARMSQAKRRR